MTRYTTRSVLLVPFLSLSIIHSHAQLCTPLAAATTGPTLTTSPGGNDNRSAVAFNPDAQLYYSLDAGSPGYPADTYDADGNFLATVPQGFDYRGAWWNPATDQLEGNGYFDQGIFVQNLDAVTHYPLGTGVVIFTAAQPDAQSIGALDTDADEIIYFFNGSIHRYARGTNTLLGVTTVTGLPVTVTDLNNNSIAYTGCAGYEIGLYDFTNKRALFLNKTTGAYSGFCQLPDTAPARASFGMSYSNGYLWLFDAPQNPGTWESYRVLNLGTAGVEETSASSIKVYPVPTSDMLQVEWPAAAAVKEMRVFDALGQNVSITSSPNGPQARQYDVSELSEGSYFLEIVTTTTTERYSFVVAH